MLAGGEKIAAVARALNLRRETISKALHRADSPLRAEVERRRAAATTPGAAPAELVEKSRHVLDQHLDSEDPRASLAAAKVVISQLSPQEPAEPEPVAEEVTPEAAVRELVATLPTIRVVLAEGPVSSELVNELRTALRAALADIDAPPAPATVAPPASPSAPPTPPPPLLN